MSSFRRTRRGVVVAFDETEASLLRHLVGEVLGLLHGGEPGLGRAGPGDPGGRPDPGGVLDPGGVPDSRPGTPVDRPLGDMPGVADLAELSGLDGPAPEPPDDPVLARLLPDGYRDDPEAAGEFRRLTESSLRQQKRDAAVSLLADLPGDGGGEVRLDRPTVERWLSTLNDVRLALGTRLDVGEDMPEPDPEDPDAPAYVVYLWLTELQEVLVQVAAET